MGFSADAADASASLDSTAWLEAVPKTFVRAISVHGSMAQRARDSAAELAVNVSADTQATAAHEEVALLAAVTILSQGRAVANTTGRLNAPMRLTLPAARPWPHVYDVRVRVTDAGGVTEEDHVQSLFALPAAPSATTPESGPRLVPGLRANGLPVWRSGVLVAGCFYPLFSAARGAALGGTNSSLGSCGKM